MIRPKLNPSCQFLFVCRNGNQLGNLGDVLGRLVYQAIGKYINPTRYRQIIETESAERLTVEEQAIVSLDQKHTSNVAKVHYQKQRSREVAKKSSDYIKSIVKSQSSVDDGSESSSTSEDEIRSTENAEHDLTLDTIPSTTRVTRSKAKSKVDSPIANSEGVTRQKKYSFTPEEDKFIINGLKRYGKGKWTNILKDPHFKFHPTRNNASIMTRARTKKFI